MKYYLSLLIIFIICSCKSFHPTFCSGSTDDIQYVIDSISRADNIVIPHDSLLEHVCVTSNRGPIVTSIYYQKIKSRQYILTYTLDSIYYYNYRIE